MKPIQENEHISNSYLSGHYNHALTNSDLREHEEDKYQVSNKLIAWIEYLPTSDFFSPCRFACRNTIQV